jgi:hypothetical protein
MQRKPLYIVFTLLIALGLLLSACQPAAQAPVITEAPPPAG